MEILYEDNHLMIVNKKPSEIVQGDKTGDVPLSEKVKEFIKKRDNKPGAVFLGVAHRIDRPVSGVLMFAKTSKSLARLNQMFQDKTIQKTYWAVVKNEPPKQEDTLTHFLKKNEVKNKSFVEPDEKRGGKKSILNYKIIAKSDNYFLLEIDPKTGRHHQIRAQLSAIKCPIKGDLKYGFDRSNSDGSIHLHAHKISFIHPVSKELIEVNAPVPKENLWQAMEKLIS
ncbi:MAG: RluA family pseudouridine synthase [Bacteroidia bacterium]